MANLRTKWVDHVVTRPQTYTETQNSDGSVTLTDAFGTVVRQGTPMNADNFNAIEDGVQYGQIASDMAYTLLQAELRDAQSRIATLEAQVAALTS